MKYITVSTKYKATKATCGDVAHNHYDFTGLDFYDPANGTIYAVHECSYWFAEQRRNKVIWLLELVDEYDKMTFSEEQEAANG